LRGVEIKRGFKVDRDILLGILNSTNGAVNKALLRVSAIGDVAIIPSGNPRRHYKISTWYLRIKSAEVNIKIGSTVVDV
jgi:hypothetical protein